MASTSTSRNPAYNEEDLRQLSPFQLHAVLRHYKANTPKSELNRDYISLVSKIIGQKEAQEPPRPCKEVFFKFKINATLQSLGLL
jgi:hypothetical protein